MSETKIRETLEKLYLDGFKKGQYSFPEDSVKFIGGEIIPYKEALSQILALTNLKSPLDLKNILAQAWYCADYDEVGDKQHKKMDEFLDDQKDFIKAISTLRPLEEKEVDRILLKAGVAGDTTRKCLVLAICSHFFKLQKYPEKKVFYGDKRDTELTSEYDQGYAKGFNQAIDDMRKLNGGRK